MRINFALGAIGMLLFATCERGATGARAAGDSDRDHDDPASDCGWCGATEAPATLASTVQIADDDESGERLVISGTVRRADGTAAAGVVLYLYHTNARGIYARRGDETGNGRRHGYLRGWLRTDSRGRYELRSIRPGAYPGGDAPAHIHITVLEPGRPEYWIDDFVFVDDPRLTSEFRASRTDIGGSGIVDVARDTAGTWRGVRDITLPGPS